MLLGTTYSHREINYLKLDHNQSFLELLDLKFDVIRLCAYWSEIEQVNGAYNFQILTNMLDTCEQRQQKVLLVVGMKSPRWPEYFIPGWIQAASVEQARSHASMFIQQAVQHLQKYSCIVAWQVENEPLDPSGPQKWIIPLSILEEEVALVKQLDPDRPVHLTAWGNELTRRQTFAQITEVADSIGLDLYYKVPQTRWMYSGPKDSDKTLKLMIQNANKPVWITELQAEPWEDDKRPSWLGRRSMSPDQLNKNYIRANQLNPQAILFWGYEYWFSQKQQGNSDYWHKIVSIIKNHNLDSTNNSVNSPELAPLTVE